MPSLGVPIWGGTINSLREDSHFGYRPEKCFDNSSNLFLIDFCNVRGLCSNFHSVEHRLSSAKLHLLLLTETQVSVTTDSNLYSIPSYYLNPPLLSKLPSFGVYPSLCSFISSFPSGRSISAVVDGQCSSPKPINSGVPQGSVLSPTLILLFINDLSVTNCPTHSYAEDSTLHFPTSFDRRPTLQDLQDFRLEAAQSLTSDLAIISDWGRWNLVSFNASKTQFLHLPKRHNLPNFLSPILRQHSCHPLQH